MAHDGQESLWLLFGEERVNSKGDGGTSVKTFAVSCPAETTAAVSARAVETVRKAAILDRL